MENENNQCFNIDETDELNKLKILNSALIMELRQSKEENTKLRHENEMLNCIIENLEDEKNALKSDFSTMKNQNPNEETIDIVENMLQTNHEIKEGQLDYYDDHTNNELNNFKFVHEGHKDDGLNEYESFPTGGKLKKYMDTFQEKHNDHKCEYCGKSFSQSEILNQHMEICEKKSLKSQVHEKVRGHKCEKCDEMFTLQKNLIVHIRVIHKERKDPKCDMCGNFFSQTTSLNRHIHTIQESHKDCKCHSCAKSFSQSGVLKRDIQNVHEGHNITSVKLVEKHSLKADI